MDYQVWTKDEYEEVYRKVDCGDLAAAAREIDAAVRKGGEPILTVEVPYKLNIKILEVGAETPKKPLKKMPPGHESWKEVRDEPEKSETEPDKVAGLEGEGEVRPGDTSAVPE